MPSQYYLSSPHTFPGRLIHKLLQQKLTTALLSFIYFDDRANFWSYGPLNTETVLVISVIYLCLLCNLKTVCDIFLKFN